MRPRMRAVIALGFLAALSSATPSTAAAQRKAAGVQRNSHGRIARSSKAKAEFRKRSGYPHGRPGYVIDHVRPLSRGGSDTPGNMQWQTREEGRAKDHIERGGSTRNRSPRPHTYHVRAYRPHAHSSRARATRTRSYSTRSSRSYSRSYSSSHSRGRRK